MSPTTSFGAPIRLTPGNGVGGYEPAVLGDKNGNIWVTAHKDYQFTAGSPDPGAPTQARNASWLWVSTDGGRHFGNPPGNTALQEQNLIVGDEADLATDGVGNVYFTDLNLASTALTQWGVRGRMLTHQHTTLEAVAEPGDDRPWIAAAGNGTVLVMDHPTSMGNNLGSNTGGDGFGPGGVNVTVSLDGGKTLRSRTPYTLRDSGFCRPWADQTPGSKNMLALCDDMSGSTSLYSFTSPDLGVHWYRHPLPVRGTGQTSYQVFFSVGQYKGTTYALYNRVRYDANQNGLPVGAAMTLLTSTDNGVHWRTSDITPGPGTYVQATLAVSPTGKLGLASYYRPNTKSAWSIMAGTFLPGQRPRLVSIDQQHSVAVSTEPQPQGDFIQNSFGADGRELVAYNSQELRAIEPVTTLALGKVGSAQVYFVRER